MMGSWSAHGGLLTARSRRASRLCSQRVESFVGELEEFRLADLQVVRVDDDVVDHLGEQLAADVLAEGRGVLLADEAALAGDGLDDALVLELGVGLGDGVAVDAQVFGQRADAGQRLARSQRAGRRPPASPGRPAGGRRPCRT